MMGFLVILWLATKALPITMLNCFLTWGAAKAEATRERITKGVILFQGVQSILGCKKFWFSISRTFRPLVASAYFCCYCNLNCFPKTEMPLISKNHVSYPSIQRNFSERCHLLRNLLVNRNWSIARPWSLYSRAAFSTSCPASPSFDQLSQGGGVGLSSGCSGRLVVCFPR